MRARLTLMIPVVALAAALSACGDDGPTKAEFVAQADGACTPGNTAISTTAKPTNAPQVATAASTAVSTIDGQVVALRALKAPGGKEKDQIQGVITALAEVSAPTKALQDAAGKADDAAMAKAALDMQAKADTAASSAQTYGLAQCGTQLKLGLGNMFDGVKNVVKTGYVAKAQGLCRDFVRKVEALTPPANFSATGRFLDGFLVISNKLGADLKALPVPPGDQGTVTDLLGAVDTMNAKFTEARAAVAANNARLVLSLMEEAETLSEAMGVKAEAYGLTACGN
jgi:hypothetical protein